MKIRALINFSGILSMHRGEELEYDNDVVLQDLLEAGYIKILEKEKSKKTKTTRKEEK